MKKSIFALCAFAAACDGATEENIDGRALDALRSTPRCYLLASGELNADCLPVTNTDDWRTFMASTDRSRVRSIDDWRRCRADSSCDPLAGVSAAVADAFTRSLVFKRGGLAGADPSMLMGALSYAAYVELWDKFGMDLSFAAQGNGWHCNDTVCYFCPGCFCGFNCY